MDPEPPGGEGYQDVTQLLMDASNEMLDGTMIMAQGFTLNEAMSAIEIGDPRMDSGAVSDTEVVQPPFDLMTPLLPEEVCWILDQALACEMQWHEGNTLMQTVHTCLYMHHLSSINPDVLDMDALTRRYTAERPIQLVTYVLGAGIFGMVKCVEFAYRELVKGNVHDCEDWQGDKADVSLYESVQSKKVLQLLDSAEEWLTSGEAADLRFRDALLYRMRLRKVLFNIFTLELPMQSPLLPNLVEQARHFIQIIRSIPIPPPRPPPSLMSSSLEINGTNSYSEPLPTQPPHPNAATCPLPPPSYSNVRASFDKHILRKLHSFMPLRPLTPPSHAEAWTALEGMLDGWEELANMAKCDCLLSWVSVSEIRTTLPRWPYRRVPYLRSAAQTVFSNGSAVLDRHPYIWLVDRFFLELTCTPLRDFTLIFTASANADWAVNVFHARLALPLYSWEDFVKDLAKLIMQHVWAAYHNRPRQRRHLMRSNVEWHSLYSSALDLITRVRTTSSHIPTSDISVLQFIPLALLHWRANVIRDIMLSGVELELYSDDELPFVYWYLWKLANTHLRVLGEMGQLVEAATPTGSPTATYLASQVELVATIKNMSKGYFFVLCQKSRFDDIRRCTNYAVRFKWMYGKDVDAVNCEDVFVPDFRMSLHEERRVLEGDANVSRTMAIDCFHQAIGYLQNSMPKVNANPVLSVVGNDYSQHFLGGLLATCKAILESLSSGDADLWPFWEQKSLRMVWKHDVCPWFPRMEIVGDVEQ